ncbi:hypothetical protein [Bosea sp. (in: a-proteobacteria)]|uniref:hypothetical protein n=1 Tax=Bosea sp. (in: a-proteobacteria) TaxID=1871050 RepID=UPI002606CA72|nr:hypothetical protein [Bosea sp. (in: a-proteobacteria)]MCO5092714.1 hypothetical protein [Bosea sp. (in: a-proteobacteria)]
MKVLHVPQPVPGKRITNHVPVEMGECRRRAPNLATSTNHDWQIGSGHGIWPAVLPSEWCGEFQSAAAELVAELERLGRCIIQCRADGKCDVVVIDGVGQSFVDVEGISQDDATLRANHWGERGLLVAWGQEPSRPAT